MAEPKREYPTTRPTVDPYGVGMLSDGQLLSYTPEQAQEKLAQRDADEAGDVTDLGDLDELDQFFVGKKP